MKDWAPGLLGPVRALTPHTQVAKQDQDDQNHEEKSQGATRLPGRFFCLLRHLAPLFMSRMVSIQTAAVRRVKRAKPKEEKRPPLYVYQRLLCILPARWLEGEG